MIASKLGEISIPWWVMAICLLPLAFGIANHDLWTPDEPREAEIAREMSQGNSPLIPTLAGKPFVEKPPLYYWISAGTMRLLGGVLGNTASARLVSALAAALTLLVFWNVIRRHAGSAEARGALLALATSYGFFHAAHWIIIDPLLMLLTAAAVLFMFDGLEGDRPRAVLGAYLAAGLAFLVKGPIAWVLVALPWGFVFFRHRREAGRRLPRHLLGLVLLLGPGIAWAIAFRKAAGRELWREWFVNNQFGRFAGKAGGHYHGPFYYLGILPLILLPWTPALIAGLLGRVRLGRRGNGNGTLPERPRGGGEPLLRLAAVWALGGLILLSLPGTKRDIYLYPLLPGFALLISRALGGPPSWARWLSRGICLLLIVVMTVFAALTPAWSREGTRWEWEFKLAVLLCALAGWLLFACLKRNLLAQVAAVTSAFYLAAALAGFPVIDRSKNYAPSIRRICAVIPEEARPSVCAWEADETTLALFPYYCGIILEDVRDAERLARILAGKDERYRIIVSLGRKFPPPDTALPPWKVLAEEKMGKRRSLLLIAGAER